MKKKDGIDGRREGFDTAKFEGDRLTVAVGVRYGVV
jgi:hypothetical protein